MAGTITLSYQNISPKIIEVTAVCTADAGDNSFPATVVTPRPSSNPGMDLVGWYLYAVHAKPGSTAPTDASDLTVTNLDGLDLLGGRGTDLLDATSITSCAAGSTVTAMPMPITGPVTLNLSNNSIASAIVTLKLLFVAG